jgi:glycerophosphoryl diester phosphodiesterase
LSARGIPAQDAAMRGYVLAAALLFGGCGSDGGASPSAVEDAAPPDAAPSDALPTDAASSDALPPDAAVPDALPPDAAPPVLDPALFDCTSLGPDGTHLPERASPVPPACALDPGCRTPQIAAHRGAGGPLGVLAPEDTLAAYRAGIAVGADFVETDPRPTADGVIVNMHDPTVDRTTDGTGHVDRLTFDQVRALHVRAGKLRGDFSCEKVPTLTEILRTCRGRVVVLVDANKTDRVDLLVQSIQEADAVDWAVFDTSSVDKIRRALAIEPRLRVMPRPDTADEITTQLDALAPTLPVIVELPSDHVADLAPLVHARGSRVQVDVFGQDLYTSQTHDPSRYQQLYDQGADILQTERPDLVRDALRARGQR